MSDCKWDARASKFAGFRSKAGSRRQFSAFGPEKRRIPARRVRAWCGPGACLVRAWCGPGAGLVRAWCGPGACLVRAWCGPGNPCRGHRIALLNPGVGTGLPHSILAWAQDCPENSVSRPASRLQIWQVLQRKWGRSSCFLRQSLAVSSPLTPWCPWCHARASSSGHQNRAKQWL